MSWPNHQIPKLGRLELEARKNRYALLIEYCHRQYISTLMTAHHHGDAMETMLYRFARGSGIYGLCGLNPMSMLDKKITLLRPLLGVSKNRLRDTLLWYGVNWVDDPSNADTSVFRRNQIRHALDDMDKDPFVPLSSDMMQIFGDIRQEIDEQGISLLLQ